MVKVKTGDRIEISASELSEGMDAEVIVLVQESMQESTLAKGLPMQGAIERVQALVRQHVPEGYSLSEELIRERRTESE